MSFFGACLEKKEVFIAGKYLILTFALDPSSSFTFLPGQYVWLIIPNLTTSDETGNRRAFSIFSSPQELPKIKILMKLGESGYKHTFFDMPIGTRVNVEGPFGSSFVLNQQELAPVVMVAGGCGISSFVSIINALPETGNDNLTLVLINSDQEVSCYEKELKTIAQSKNVRLIAIFGHFKTDDLPDDLPYETANFYISASPDLVTALNASLLSKGVSSLHLNFEQYYPESADMLTETYFGQNVAKDNILLQAILDSNSHVVITDTNGQIIFANPTAEKNTGYSFAEMKHNTPRLWGGLMEPQFYRDMWSQLKAGKSFDGEFLNRRKNGERYTVIAHISPIFKQGKVIGYIGTEEDISERVLLEEQKTQFVSVASHQLRTPLGITRWYVEALQKHSYLQQAPSEVKQYLTEISKSNERILRLVQDLLTVSRLDQGRTSNTPVEINVSELLRDLVSEMSILAQQKNIDFQFQVQTSTAPILFLDAIRLREIYANLIANAFEFTPDGGKIIVQLSTSKDQVIVSVTDTGIGIAPQDKEKLFKKFVRLEKAVKVNPNGTGLGLYIVKTTVEEWNGTVQIESIEGQGSTFTVSLPIHMHSDEAVQTFKGRTLP